MKENKWLRKILQYGYETDVFDKYRDAVTRYNCSALKVLSIAGVLAGLGGLIFAIVNRNNQIGLFICLILLAAGVAGAVVSRKKESQRGAILLSGYLLCAAFYAFAIYGNIRLGKDAFWVGVNMAMCCYLLDYSLRLVALQGVSFIALIIGMDRTIGDQDPEKIGLRLIVCSVFLVAGFVTMFSLGRARLGLILGREVSKQQADTDLLTGLMMRSAAKEDIEAHLTETQEAGVLMLLDLDRFKSVNDRLGHQMGDKVLIDVSADLKKMFRNSDVLSRLGGDEFIIYMKAVPEDNWAQQRAEQVVRTVRRWVGDGTTNIQVTASVGVVMTGTVDRVYEDMYRAADIAMYFSKAQGGNNMVIYSRDLLNQARSGTIAQKTGATEETAEEPTRAEELR